jgi:hypothetical protein
MGFLFVQKGNGFRPNFQRNNFSDSGFSSKYFLHLKKNFFFGRKHMLIYFDIKSGVAGKLSLSIIIANHILILRLINFDFAPSIFSENSIKEQFVKIESRYFLDLCCVEASSILIISKFIPIRTLFTTLKQADKHCNCILEPE